MPHRLRPIAAASDSADLAGHQDGRVAGPMAEGVAVQVASQNPSPQGYDLRRQTQPISNLRGRYRSVCSASGSKSPESPRQTRLPRHRTLPKPLNLPSSTSPTTPESASPSRSPHVVSLLGPLPLPYLSTTLDQATILARLDALARRGKLAGFETHRAGSPILFQLEAPGAPFDHALEATPAQGSGETRLSLRLRMLPKLPAMFGLLILFTIWPGVWLTHSMLRAYFSFYTYPEWITWAWYIPFTVLPLPWMLAKVVRRSRESAYASALESVEILKTTLDAKAFDRA